MFLRKPKSFLAGLLTILSLANSPLHAEQITLNSLDGTVSMSGELLGYDGATYTIGMLVGDISLDASQVICVGAACPDLAAGLVDFEISGAAGVSENLLPSLIEVFALDRGGDLEVSSDQDGSRTYSVLEADGAVYANITIKPSDSTDGIASLMEGSSVIGVSSRRVNDNEIAAFDLGGKGQIDSAEQEQILALDAVVATVNANNPVHALSLAQMRAIFEGRITNWSEVGGNNAAIVLYRTNAESNTMSAFSTASGGADTSNYSNSATILDSDLAVSDAVAADKDGMGLTRFSQERNAQAVSIRSVCGEVFEVSDYAVKSGEYPLSQRLYVYTAKTGLPDVAAAFLEFLKSSTAQLAIRTAGYVDQSISFAGLDAQGRRLAQAIVSSSGRTELLQLQDLSSILLDAERISFSLHYDENGELDARAHADIERLASVIQTGAFSGRQLLVFGFSDNLGAVNAQLVATQAIAQKVRDEIVSATGRAKLGNLRISPIGYGRLMPLSCNETASGRQNNNHVEIWLK